MAPPIVLHTLGVPHLLTSTGEKIRFRTRKHFALLIRLAVEPGKSFTRDYLTELLWSDVPPRLARHSLSQSLFHLRGKVGRDHFVIAHNEVTLAAGAVDTDVQHLGAGDAPITGGFLDGFEVSAAPGFGQWKDSWRAKLLPQIRECLVRRIHAGRRVGNFAAVEQHAQALHDLDPLCEDAIRGLIEARAWAGDRSGALQAFKRFQWDLSLEGVAPSPNLVRMADLLRDLDATSPDRSPARKERRFEAEPLIGREREFTRLYDAWLDVRRRQPRIIVVTGDPGVGKTTLTNAFVSSCQMEGAVVARAQAYDAERELPFAVLAELIRQLTRQRAIGAVDPDALGELSRVSPEIASAFPGAPKPVAWSAEVIPLRLADAFLNAVEAVTQECPLVLVVDDIHAADNASAAILHMMARKLPDIRLLLILVGRPNDLRTAAAPSALISDTTVRAFGALDLDQLPPGAAARLVGTIVTQSRGRIGEVPSARIQRAGNGNPLALELLTKEWMAHGSSSLLSDIEALNTQPVARLGVPRAIEAVFERQMRRLDAPIRTALGLAAVLGRRLADLPLYEVIDLTPPTAGEALSRLREEGFLREVHGALEFRNELIRAQAYYAVAGPARQHLHRQVGELLALRDAIESRSSNLEIAWHFLRGGDPERALPFALKGVDTALHAGAPYEAEQILETLVCEPRLAPSSPAIRLLLATALLDQSKAERATPVLETLVNDRTLGLRGAADATRMRATAVYLRDLGTGDEYCDAVDRALDAARSTRKPAMIVRALFEYARSGVATGSDVRVRNAQTEVERLLSDARVRQLPVTYYTLGYCHYFLFEPRRAAGYLETAKGLLADGSNVTELSHVYNGYANCKFHLCELSAAQEAYATGLQVASRVGDDSRRSIISANLCGLLSMMGEYGEAIDVGLQGIRCGTRALNQPLLTGSYTALAEAHGLAGDRKAALEALRRAGEWADRKRVWSVHVDYLCQSAGIALMMADVSWAIDLIGQAEDAARGRERAVPNVGVFEKLRIFRTAHVLGDNEARALADAAMKCFRVRHPLYYLSILSARAWLEKRTTGRYAADTRRELGRFVQLRLDGYQRLLKAQGFLS